MRTGSSSTCSSSSSPKPTLTIDYARSAAEATEVLEETTRGMLAITSLAEESRPPAAGGGDQH